MAGVNEPPLGRMDAVDGLPQKGFIGARPAGLELQRIDFGEYQYIIIHSSSTEKSAIH